MTPLDAMRLARRAHQGQRYNGDSFYTAHVAQVARRVADDPKATLDAIVVAYLHDVLADTPTTIDELIDAGITIVQRRAVLALLHRPNDPYETYIVDQVCPNRIAALVKFHELEEELANNPPAEKAGQYLTARKAVREARMGVTRCHHCREPVVVLETRKHGMVRVNRDTLPEEFDVLALKYNPKIGHLVHHSTCRQRERFWKR